MFTQIRAVLDGYMQLLRTSIPAGDMTDTVSFRPRAIVRFGVCALLVFGACNLVFAVLVKKGRR